MYLRTLWRDSFKITFVTLPYRKGQKERDCIDVTQATPSQKAYIVLVATAIDKGKTIIFLGGRGGWEFVWGLKIFSPLVCT